VTIHLQKLCVGCDSIEDLAGWIAESLAAMRKRGEPVEQVHRTRMSPKRIDELLDGGSLFWVIKGKIQCRQTLLDIRAGNFEDGTACCVLVLDPKPVPVDPQPRRPFQGWRYLPDSDAPADIGKLTRTGGLPPHLVRELRSLGLW
jgi:hypothetical protein